jgi:hypothetical protein
MKFGKRWRLFGNLPKKDSFLIDIQSLFDMVERA